MWAPERDELLFSLFPVRGTEQIQALTLLKRYGYCHGSGASWFPCKQTEGLVFGHHAQLEAYPAP